MVPRCSMETTMSKAAGPTASHHEPLRPQRDPKGSTLHLDCNRLRLFSTG
jgi:hypothetical protein